jgi:hypothetical protein
MVTFDWSWEMVLALLPPPNYRRLICKCAHNLGRYQPLPRLQRFLDLAAEGFWVGVCVYLTVMTRLPLSDGLCFITCWRS